MEIEGDFRESFLWAKQHGKTLSLPDIKHQGREAVNKVSAS